MLVLVVGDERIELSTSALSELRSTTELAAQILVRGDAPRPLAGGSTTELHARIAARKLTQHILGQKRARLKAGRALRRDLPVAPIRRQVPSPTCLGYKVLPRPNPLPPPFDRKKGDRPLRETPSAGTRRLRRIRGAHVQRAFP